MTPSDPDSHPADLADDLAAAEARAATARARADELRRQLQAAEEAQARRDAWEAEEAETEEANGAEDVQAPDGVAEAGPSTSASRTSVPRLAGVVAAALVTAALLAATGYMTWQHFQQVRERQQAAEYSAAARQGVINLMSIDYATAQDSVKRVLDGSTGRFKTNFADTADDFVKALRDEKIVTKATVNDAAVESMTSDSAVVLISATSRREGPQAPKDQQEPRLWRVVLTLERDGDQIKMSGVEFV